MISEEDFSILLSYEADKNDVWLGLKRTEVSECWQCRLVTFAVAALLAVDGRVARAVHQLGGRQ